MARLWRQLMEDVHALQWGHGREAMDGAMPGESMPDVVSLQWGHGREAMDG